MRITEQKRIVYIKMYKIDTNILKTNFKLEWNERKRKAGFVLSNTCLMLENRS
jgi:hypothetical protein